LKAEGDFGLIDHILAADCVDQDFHSLPQLQLLLYGFNFIFVAAFGVPGLVKTKGTVVEHDSPQTGSVMQAATVKDVWPTKEGATSILIEPSGCAGTATGTHAGPVSLYVVIPACGSQTRKGEAKENTGISKKDKIIQNFFIRISLSHDG
jgi:hypothetical protein